MNRIKIEVFTNEVLLIHSNTDDGLINDVATSQDSSIDYLMTFIKWLKWPYEEITYERFNREFI